VNLPKPGGRHNWYPAGLIACDRPKLERHSATVALPPGFGWTSFVVTMTSQVVVCEDGRLLEIAS
jgi:hypothetical protein